MVMELRMPVVLMGAAPEPQAKAIAVARTRRKKENGRPRFLMADLLGNTNSE
jgi:hypothetical protein